MTNPSFIAIALAVIVFVLFVVFGNRGMNTLPKVLERAKAKESAEPIVQFIRQHPPHEREDLWDQALSQLWRSYDRELAAQLLVFALQPIEKKVVGSYENDVSTVLEPNSDSDIKILHYWVTQVLQIEPEIAQQVFSRDFLDTAFRPELASCCGKGCCG